MKTEMKDTSSSDLILITLGIILYSYFLEIKEINLFSGIVLFFLAIAWLGTIVRFLKQFKKH